MIPHNPQMISHYGGCYRGVKSRNPGKNIGKSRDPGRKYQKYRIPEVKIGRYQNFVQKRKIPVILFVGYSDLSRGAIQHLNTSKISGDP